MLYYNMGKDCFDTYLQPWFEKEYWKPIEAIQLIAGVVPGSFSLDRVASISINQHEQKDVWKQNKRIQALYVSSSFPDFTIDELNGFLAWGQKSLEDEFKLLKKSTNRKIEFRNKYGVSHDIIQICLESLRAFEKTLNRLYLCWKNGGKGEGEYSLQSYLEWSHENSIDLPWLYWAAQNHLSKLPLPMVRTFFKRSDRESKTPMYKKGRVKDTCLVCSLLTEFIVNDVCPLCYTYLDPISVDVACAYKMWSLFSQDVKRDDLIDDQMNYRNRKASGSEVAGMRRYYKNNWRDLGYSEYLPEVGKRTATIANWKKYKSLPLRKIQKQSQELRETFFNNNEGVEEYRNISAKLSMCPPEYYPPYLDMAYTASLVFWDAKKMSKKFKAKDNKIRLAGSVRQKTIGTLQEYYSGLEYGTYELVATAILSVRSV